MCHEEGINRPTINRYDSQFLVQLPTFCIEHLVCHHHKGECLSENSSYRGW